MSENNTQAERGSLRARIGRWFASPPCYVCGVEGGSRWPREERVGNRIVKRQLCRACDRTAFFRPWQHDHDWVR